MPICLKVDCVSLTKQVMHCHICHMLSVASEILTDLDGLRRHLAPFQSMMTRCLRDVTSEFVWLLTLRLMAYRARHWGTAQVAPAMLVNPCQGLRRPHTHKYTICHFAVSESKSFFFAQQCLKYDQEELQISTVNLIHLCTYMT